MASIDKILQEDCSIQKPIALFSPITINGKEMHELDWSGDEVTVDLYDRAVDAAAIGSSNAIVAEMDKKFHRSLGFAMIIAKNPEIDMADLNQLKGADLMKVAAMGRFFILRSASADGKTSEDSSDTTPESSTPQLETYESEES